MSGYKFTNFGRAVTILLCLIILYGIVYASASFPKQTVGDLIGDTYGEKDGGTKPGPKENEQTGSAPKESEQKNENEPLDTDEIVGTGLLEGAEYRFSHIGRIIFAPESSELSNEARDALEAFVKEHLSSEGIIVVEGHAFDGGKNSPEYLLELSYSRAASVADYLLSLGVSRKMIRVDAGGSSNGLSGETPEIKAETRRVELYFLNLTKK